MLLLMDLGQKCRVKRVLQCGVFFSCFLISINLLLLYLLPFQISKNIDYPDDEAPSDKSFEFNAFSGKVISCNLSGSTLAIKALDRAKTAECKQQIRAAACMLKEKGSIHPIKFISRCPLVDLKRAGKYHSCVQDRSVEKRIFKNQMLNLNQTNTVKLCIDSCFRVGSALAGVQYGFECYCGDTVPENTPVGVFKTHCAKYRCPGDKSVTCGGHWWMAVYETGFNANIKKSGHVQYVDPADPAEYGRSYPSEEESEPHVKILYFLALNGRNDRQVLRLLRLIYRKQHFYYIHVDKRADYLYRRIVEVTKEFDNIFVTEQRWAMIWGGASLLQIYLSGTKEVMTKTDWKWEYLLNYSESDLPLLSVEEITAQLTRNRGYNFVRSHAISGDRFLSKQGLKKVFLECDQHLWRIGERIEPTGVWINGGSDWFVLHRDFLNYTIYGDDDLITGLKEMYKYALLPGESFFHTVLHNSKFCQTYVNSNFKITNWKKGQGCQCQYAHAVDWCGCSPKVFDISDRDRLDRPRIIHKLQYSARKFDPIINVDIINFVERRMFALEKLPYVNHNSVWYNAYCSLDHLSKVPEYKLQLMESLARISTRAFLPASGIKDGGSVDSEMKPNSSDSTFDTPPSCHCDLHSIRPTNQWMYKPRDGEANTILITFNISCGGQIREMECWLERIPKFRLLGKHPLHPLLVHLDVGMNYDAKELMFRDYLGGVGISEIPTLRYEWKSGEVGKAKSSSIDVDWKDSSGKVVSVQAIQIDPVKPVQVRPFTPDDSRPDPYKLRPGTWTVTLLQNEVSFAETKFLIVPSDPGSLKSILLKKKTPTTTKTPAMVHKSRRELSVDYGDDDDVNDIPEEPTDEQLHTFLDDSVRDFYVPKGLCLMDRSANVNSKESPKSGNDSPESQANVAESSRTRNRSVPESGSDKCLDIFSALPLCSFTPWSSAAPDPKSEFKIHRITPVVG